MKEDLTVRRAELKDVDAIFSLLEIYAAEKVVLPRTREDIALFIGNFTVAEIAGEVCGCAALRDFGNDLLEVRSLVVSPVHQGKGIGRSILAAMIGRLRAERGKWRLFTLTLRPGFFRTLGFREVPKALFPEKIWSDCSKCGKRCCCDETALLMESDGN